MNENTGFEFEFEIPDVGFESENTVPVSPPCGAMPLSVPDALIECVKRIGRVDMDHMCGLSGKSCEEIASLLGGSAIFQDPEVFADADVWNPRDGWLLREQFLSVNVKRKLNQVRELMKKFPGYFCDEERVLAESVPPAVPIDDIDYSLEAP